ncbi:dynein light chain Tctex-type 5 isoform X2 [Erinaceus europaeus]|uniref:Dynein light chain Tctex-type 5 isoform X2 n=1 Tax=Erinaceus europaeus TaxID=9365 RepID=A0ABM3YMS8_ERIEU|nr:dynein light chain Tctex-type 5 isoform X2 [Erinaceus europaeus]
MLRTKQFIKKRRKRVCLLKILMIIRRRKSIDTPEGPTKNFPVGVVNHILKAVLTKHLQEAQYEPESCRLKAKKISEVIKARVKDLMIPRFKLTVIVYIGQLEGQSILIGSRCLWDPKTDAFSSCDFRNFSLFALANVYAVYFE